MEECCAVCCAEPLEWLAYGPCGHREICSTCTSRLRFIFDVKKCCICRQECPNVVITKALGDYTNAVGDFSTLPAPANEGRVGNYWFHLDTQAYFDDEQHYKMIKAMCRLSCSVCDNPCGAKEPRKELPKRDREFKHIVQLTDHLFDAHKLFMCTLCLEGREVFICEQKLYTQSQLDRHLSRGDSEVDGSETERGGFMGHPICDFCRKQFYGDTELKMHMSRDHYNSGQNSDPLPSLLSSDMVASSSTSTVSTDPPRYLTAAIWGALTAARRRRALNSRGALNSLLEESAFPPLPGAPETDPPRYPTAVSRRALATAEDFSSGQSSDPLPSLLSSNMVASSSRSTVSTDPPRYLTAVMRKSAFTPLPGASETDPPRHPTAVSRRAPNSPLEESAFPPLPVASGNVSHKSMNKGKRSVKSTAALVHGGQGNIRVPNAAESRQNLGPGQLSSLYPVNSSSNQTNGSRNMNYSSRSTVAAVVRGGQGNTRVLNAAESRNSFGPGQLSSLYQTNGNRNMNYSSRPTVVNAQEPVLNSNEFPPILGRHHVSAASATENQGQASNTPLLSIEEVRAANKELIESIQSGLGGNEQQFAAFKDVSARFRNGDIGARKYYSHISKLGLSHLVPRLARLCPDQDKGRKLLEAHEAGIKKNSQLAVNQIINQTGGISIGLGSIDNHRKGKTVDVGSSKDVTSSSNADSGRSLGKPSEEVEVLSKDGYRTAKGKAKPRETPVLNGMSGTSGSSSEEPADHCQRPPPLSDSLNAYHDEKWTCNACSLLNKQDSLLCLVCGTERPNGRFMKEPNYGRKGKQKKKASKAQRGNLDDSLASIESNQSSSVSSVWGNGGGQRLVSIAQR